MSKKALIITDGTASINSIAQAISQALDGFKVKICQAENFEGTDLLSAEIFFIGCESEKLPSFAYLEEMLSHINLASRKSGIFSVKEKPLDYLRGILKDSEAGTWGLFVASKGELNKPAVKKWVKGLV